MSSTVTMTTTMFTTKTATPYSTASAMPSASSTGTTAAAAPLTKQERTRRVAGIFISVFLITLFSIGIATIAFIEVRRRRRRDRAARRQAPEDIELQVAPPPPPPPRRASPEEESAIGPDMRGREELPPAGDGTFRFGQFLAPPTAPERSTPVREQRTPPRRSRFVEDIDGSEPGSSSR